MKNTDRSTPIVIVIRKLLNTDIIPAYNRNSISSIDTELTLDDYCPFGWVIVYRKSLNLCPGGFKFNDVCSTIGCKISTLEHIRVIKLLSRPHIIYPIAPLSHETLINKGFRHYTKNHLLINLTLSIDGYCYGTPDWVRTSDLQSRSCKQGLLVIVDWRRKVLIDKGCCAIKC